MFSFPIKPKLHSFSSVQILHFLFCSLVIFGGTVYAQFPMQILCLQKGALVCFWLSVLFVVTVFCNGDHSTVEVVGIGECADCKQLDIKSGHAFSGLFLTIDCKTKTGHFKTRASGELDGKGSFKVSLPNEIVENGELKEECYAQLHSASAAPCPAHDGLDSSKIFIKSKTDGGKHTLGPAGKLKFSSATCTSALLWPSFKFPPLPSLPPLKSDPFFKKFGHIFNFPPKVFPPFPPKVFPPITYKKPLPPPIPIFKKPLPPPIPVFKKPLPPPIPVNKKPLPPPIPIFKKPLPPPIPVYKKPLPPPIPIFKKPLPPPTPVSKKPLPPPIPVYKKPLPPPVPVYKKSLPPPIPIFKKPLPPPLPILKKPLPPPIPIYKPKPLPPPIPIFKKPLPPIYKKPLPPPIPIYKPPLFKKPLPPIYEKPLPPLIPICKPPLFKKPLPPIYKKPLPPPIPIFKPPFIKPHLHFPDFPPFKKKPVLPIPKFPLPTLPPLPKLPPHPMFGKWPPLSP